MLTCRRLVDAVAPIAARATETLEVETNNGAAMEGAHVVAS
jgi:hypothetical protein